MPKALVRYDEMCRAIDAAYKVDEVKGIRDTAVALEAYAKQAHNTEAERRACEIRLRAERKAGQLSAKLDRSNPGKRKKDLGRATRPKSEVLKDAGITKDQASKWEKLGAVPQRDFDEALEQSDKPTTNGIIRATSAPKPNPVSKTALWLWARLRDFRDDGLLDQSPDDVMRTMTAEMKDEVHTLAPRVSAWLKRIGALS